MTDTSPDAVERLSIVAKCDTDSTMRHFAYAVVSPDAKGDYVYWTDYAALLARLQEAEKRYLDETAGLRNIITQWEADAAASEAKFVCALKRAEKAEAERDALKNAATPFLETAVLADNHALLRAIQHVRSTLAKLEPKE